MFKKILFFSFPLAGHVNPQIGLGEALEKKAWKWYFIQPRSIFTS